MTSTTTERTLQQPTAPTTLERAGLSLDLVIQLALKLLHLNGELAGIELADRLGLNFSAIEPAIETLISQRLVEIRVGTMLGRSTYRYRITDNGRVRAALFLKSSHYVGVAPVPLEQYRQYVAQFAECRPARASREQVREAFSHLVLSDRVLDQLGAALNGGHSMFVYGHPGNGKTAISQAIRCLVQGEIAVPHALEVEGNIIQVFDPVNHEPVQREKSQVITLDGGSQQDRRWVICKRPMVMAGGELTIDELELGYNVRTGVYSAPIQARANGGVLVIDDFGRQPCSPRELLNRWIVPLESGADFLTLKTGQKFALPFLALVVFATNIKPAELVDEAFLRRIRYKVFAESPSLTGFLRIFERVCAERGVPFDQTAVEHMLQTYYKPRMVELRACQPRDLVEGVLALADYGGVPRELSAQLLKDACATYFVQDRELPPSYA
jgi:predicted ATPase with chaperone activity